MPELSSPPPPTLLYIVILLLFLSSQECSNASCSPCHPHYTTGIFSEFFLILLHNLIFRLTISTVSLLKLSTVSLLKFPIFSYRHILPFRPSWPQIGSPPVIAFWILREMFLLSKGKYSNMRQEFLWKTDQKKKRQNEEFMHLTMDEWKWPKPSNKRGGGGDRASKSYKIK